jgi:hypothetical protein
VLFSLPAQVVCYAALFFAGSPLALTLALLAAGAAAGCLDLAMNAESTTVERSLGRPVVLSMHAAASAGFAIGALGGSLISTSIGPAACLLPVLLIVLPVAWAVSRLPPPPHDAALPETRGGTGHVRGLAALWRSVAWLGIVLGVCIAAEMAAQMWSARFLVRQAEDLAAFAGAGAAFFAACQVVVRLTGDPLRRRFGDPRMIVGSLLLAALGFVTVALSPLFSVSLIGFALVGLGTGCVVPCCFALIARRDPARGAAALGVASLTAGLIRLPAPLYLGFVAAAFSDAVAFAGIAVALVFAALLMRLDRPAR